MARLMRPTISLTGEYADVAKAAWSRTLEEPHKFVLTEAAAGNTVDVLDLNAALMRAMRSSATRGAQSTERRRLAAEIQILANVVQDMLTSCFSAERADGVRVAPPQPREQAPEELEEWLDA